METGNSRHARAAPGWARGWGAGALLLTGNGKLARAHPSEPAGREERLCDVTFSNITAAGRARKMRTTATARRGKWGEAESRA